MNLNMNPTIEQLRELVKNCDDFANDHVLWARKTGEVAVTRVAQDETAAGFECAHPDMQMRFETFLAGNEYVGPEAAADDDWISELFDRLTKRWQQARGKPEIAYSERF